jgi:O-antigen ligase
LSFYSIILQIIPFLIIIYYSYYFFKKKYHITNLLSFPIYIYWASYPFLISNKFFILPSLHKIIAILAILVAIINVVLYKKKIYFNKYELCFLLIVCISWFYMEFPSNYYVGLTNIIYIFLLTFSFYNTGLMREPKIIGQIFVLNSVILSSLAVIEYLLFNTRVSVTLFNPNYLAIYIVFGFVILIFYKIKYRLILAALILIAMLLTKSDAVMFGLIIPIIILLIHKLRLKPVYKILLPSVLFLFFIGLIFSISQSVLSDNNITSFFNSFINNSLSTGDTLRFDIWKIAVDMFLDNPILGIGYNQFQAFIEFLAPQYSLITIREGGFVTHNDFIRILVELGLIGFLPFIAYVSRSLKYANKSQDIKMRMTCISLILILLFFSYTHNNINSFLFWVTLALPIYKRI